MTQLSQSSDGRLGVLSRSSKGAAAVQTVNSGKRWSNIAFVLPSFCVYIFALLYPFLSGAWLSLHNADLFGSHRFVGFGNFVRLFSDTVFLECLWNTIYFCLLTVPALTVAGLGLALLLNRRSVLAAFLRGAFFSPAVLSVTIVALLWRAVLMLDGGLLANIAESAGLAPIRFLSDPRWVMPGIAITTIWWCLGLPMMIFLAALQQIPRELYEAAALDGAGKWKMLRCITIPSIRRTIVLVVSLEVVLQFQLFGQAQLMTQGGPNNASRPLVLYIYDVGFNRWDAGYAAAASQILFALILIAAVALHLSSRRREALQ